MYFYVGENALKELNEWGYTKILNEDGVCLGGELSVSYNGVDCPYIYNLFDCAEVIWLDEFELEDDHFNCKVTTDGRKQCFALYILKPSKVGLKTKWTRE
ncbi:MAG: hypothetical protein IKU98_01420 [Bacteroidaceae bacterium]|nr:hypothetical protein [Bacteroidaceae bacterium]